MDSKTDTKDVSPKKSNAALDSFKHEREKGFIRNRFLAALVDFIIIGFICQLAFYAFGAPDWGAYGASHDEVVGLGREDERVVERARLYNECLIISLAIGAAYETLFLALFDTTPGKQLFGFKLISKKEDRGYLMSRLFYLIRAVVKSFSIYLISAIPFIFMCLTTYGNEEGRSGFDLLAGTKVVSKSKGITAVFKRKS
ncbi:MAG: RDD family protein [Oscillospiraceae bacterium]|nr:RDD family protein [Oscillospiraceae bacterium]